MPLVVTTWNVQNFTKSDVLFDDKLNFLVSVIQGLNSDVVALQEILDPNALQAIADRLSFKSFAAAPDGRNNRVAFLTRNSLVAPPKQIDQWQLAQNTEVRDFNNNGQIKTFLKFPRPALQITIAHEGKDIDIINAHLKSKLLTFGSNFSTSNETLRAQTAFFALERRAAEATSLREHVTGLLLQGRHVVVLGDLNDGPEAATTELLYGPPGSQPRNSDDATNKNGAFQRADAEDKQRLFNVTKFVPENLRWSRKHNGQNELLDHILSSEGLMPRKTHLRQVPTVEILNEDTPNLLGLNPNQGGIVPDHAPVTATFFVSVL